MSRIPDEEAASTKAPGKDSVKHVWEMVRSVWLGAKRRHGVRGELGLNCGGHGSPN